MRNTDPVTSATTRRAELAGNLDRTRARIAAAALAAGRDPSEVTLIAVTKTYPASDVVHLATLGVGDIGENRDQEAAPKAAQVAAAGVDVRWHYIGQLQRNKCPSVATYATVVHSVDRLSLVAALAKARDAARDTLGVPVLDVAVQCSLDGDVRRGGALAADLPVLAEAIAAQPSLRLVGVMAVAPLDQSPDQAFATLAATAADLRRQYPSATLISAGMSGDLELAVAYGATHVRIGSALLGTRPPLR